MSDLRSRAERRVDQKIKFYRNFYSYIIVNAILAVINYLFTPEYWWVLFVVFFWGIGVLFDFLKAFILFEKFDSEQYREQKINEEMEKMRK
ncbi:MAG: 2TM domain-containing protein [Methanobrevibacter sp.]|nr:2TM domain-containing protein [Methanobrevibacter sp.]